MNQGNREMTPLNGYRDVNDDKCSEFAEYIRDVVHKNKDNRGYSQMKFHNDMTGMQKQKINDTPRHKKAMMSYKMKQG